MSSNELHAALSALFNGEDPDTGEAVEFDDNEPITAEVAGEFAGVLSDGSPQRFTVTGFRVVDGRLVLDMREDDYEEGRIEDGRIDKGDEWAGQPDVPPIPPPDETLPPTTGNHNDDPIPF